MNIFELIETCNLDQQHLNQSIRYDVCNAISQRDLIRVGRYLVDNLDRSHGIPGDQHNTMCGIIDWYREHGDITHRQKIYLFNAVVNYWNYLSCDARSQLLI